MFQKVPSLTGSLVYFCLEGIAETFICFFQNSEDKVSLIGIKACVLIFFF